METRYTGESTLDEPVSQTIVRETIKAWPAGEAEAQMRDLRSIYAKLQQVLYPPKGGGTNQLLRFGWLLAFELC